MAKKFLLFALLFVFLTRSVFPQPPENWTSAEIYQALRKLNVLGSVLYVAAHPDDENTRLIAWLSKDRLFRTGYLSMTRGDGGQNLIGGEQGIELGLIRTQELLAARRIDGGEQFFSRAYDFGYSKNPEETFSKWDREKILSDVVWVIRKFQPDVIITRFPTTGEGGHGHHTASAILANDAFNAAADPSKFTEQLKYVKPWQAKRILWNTFNFGGNNTTREDQFKIDVGGYNPLLGKSYGEISAESRSQHKSQGFGVPSQRGESLEYFKLTGGPEPSGDLMDGIELGWEKVPGGQPVKSLVDSLVTGFDFIHPEKSVNGLVRLHRILNALPASHWKIQKLKEVQQLILQCSGLFLDATTTEAFAVRTDSIRINFSVNNRLGSNAILKAVTIPGYLDTALNQPLGKNKNLNFPKTFLVKQDHRVTQPYWLVHKMAEGYFNVESLENIGQPNVDPAYIVQFSLEIEGEKIDFNREVKYKFTDPVRGELYEPLAVIPKVLVYPDTELKLSINENKISGNLVFVPKTKSSPIHINTVTTGEKDVEQEFKPATFTLQLKDGLYVIDYSIMAKKDKEYQFYLDNGGAQGNLTVKNANGNGIDKNRLFPGENLIEIKYDHIPYIRYFQKATVKNVRVDLKTYNKRIGYIVGAGDKVPEGLEQMGYEVTLLTNKELARNDLSRFDAIITGIRAYNTNDWMNNFYPKLMKYVNDGGNLIVQYNTSSQLGPVKSKIGPYTFNISRTRVSEETSPVTILKPEHQVFNFPNKITNSDFDGWVQERSIYHASAWDSTKFDPVLSMADAGEKQDLGGLIISRYGKGYFTYTGLVFFRQLPAGVPGAYRLLANLIALNRKKAF